MFKKRKIYENVPIKPQSDPNQKKPMSKQLLDPTKSKQLLDPDIDNDFPRKALSSDPNMDDDISPNKSKRKSGKLKDLNFENEIVVKKNQSDK